MKIVDASTDPHIDPQVRAFLAELNKDSSPSWELPQPKPQDILKDLQNKTLVDMPGVTTVEKTINEDGHTMKLYVMTPATPSARICNLNANGAGAWAMRLPPAFQSTGRTSCE